MGSRGNPTLADVSNDFLVGEEYWDLLGGKGTYDDLLLIIEAAGKKYRPQIQQKIKEVAEKKISKT